MNFFIIRGLAPGLDGLLAESEESIDLDTDAGPDELCIKRLRNRNIFTGDREFSVELPDGALFISREFLQPVDDPGLREYGTDNEHGKFQSERTLYKGDVKLSIADFDNLMAITIRDDNRTLFSQNFTGKHRAKAELIVTEYTNDYTKDIADMVFELRELEENQRNGK